MRGPSKSLPKYRKHKATGQVIVTLSGKDFYLGPHGTKASNVEYDRVIGEWLANDRQSPNPTGDHSITIVQLIAQYWRHCKTYYVKNDKPTDEQAGVKAAVKPLKRIYGKTLAKDFGPLALESVREDMIARNNSRKYINQNVGRICLMFKWAVSKVLIPVQTFHALKTVSGLKAGKSKARETQPVLPVPKESH